MNLFYLSAVHNLSLLSFIVSNRWSQTWNFLQRTRLSWALSRRLSFASLWSLTAQSSVLLILCSLRERRRSQRENLSAVSAQTVQRFWSRTDLPDSKHPDIRCKYWRFEREKVRKRTFFLFHHWARTTTRMNVFAKCAPQRQQNEGGRDGILER